MQTTENQNINMDSDILHILDIPKSVPTGWKSGTIVDIGVSKHFEGTKVKQATVDLTVALDVNDDAGVPFEVTRSYNALGRGLKDLAKDVSILAAQKLTEADVANLNKRLVLNQRVEVEVKTRKEGSKTIAYFNELRAPTATTSS